MAELTSAAPHSRKPGARRSKKLSTRVDLTPMVDLGFLLITFFMVSTSWSKPRASKVNMPADGPSVLLGQNAALTLVALDSNKVFYYNGDFEQSLKENSFGVTGYSQHGGIGDIIRRKQSAMDRSYKGGRREMMLLVKPSPQSNFQNVIGLLDEVLINDVKKYALLDLTVSERTAVEIQAARRTH